MKGGNALDFVWHPNRSTRDLDFSVDMELLDRELNPEQLKALLDPVLHITARRHGMALALHRVRQRPPGTDRSFFAFEVRIGYALPDEARLRVRMEAGETSSQIIPLDISMNDVVCATADIPIEGRSRLRVATIEDVTAEKLRAIL